MRKFYFFMLALMTVATYLFSRPDVALYALIFTVGLAYPILVFMPMVCFSLWVALPSVLLSSNPRWRMLSRISGVCVLGLTIFLPVLLADWGAARDIANREIVEPKAQEFAKPIGIEIMGPTTAGPKPCFDVCERLLTGGDVEWIRLVIRGSASGSYAPETRAYLKPGSPEECQAIDQDFSPGQRCALFSADNKKPADLTLIQTTKLYNSKSEAFKLYQPTGYSAAAAYRGSQTSGAPLFHFEQVSYDRPLGFITFNLGTPGGRDGGGFMFPRTRTLTKPIDLASAVQALGLKLGPVREDLPKLQAAKDNILIHSPPDAQDAAYVASLVAIGPGRGYDDLFASLVQDWHNRLRWKAKLTSSDIAIFCASIANGAVTRFFWKDAVIRQHQIACI